MYASTITSVYNLDTYKINLLNILYSPIYSKTLFVSLIIASFNFIRCEFLMNYILLNLFIQINLNKLFASMCKSRAFFIFSSAINIIKILLLAFDRSIFNNGT